MGIIDKAVTSGVAKQILKEVDDLILKKGTTKNPSKLLQKKKDVKIGDKEINVGPKGETTEIGIKDFKGKAPVASKESIEEFLKSFGNSKLPKEALMDFRIEKFTQNQDIFKVIDSISKSLKPSDVVKQTRGVRSNTATKSAGTRKSQDENFLLEVLGTKAGQTYNAEQIYAIRQLLEAGTSRLNYLAKKVADPDNVTNLDVVNFRQHYALMSQIQKVLMGVKTETGRALQQFQIPTNASKKYSLVGGNVDDLNRESLIVELGGFDEIRGVAKLYLSSPDNNVRRLKAVQETGLMSFATKASNTISEVFLNAILSNPMTHVRNWGGNWITQAIVDQERKLASRLFSKFGKGEGANYISSYEDVAKSWGKHMAATEIMASMKNAYKLGGSKLDQRVGQISAQNYNVSNKFFASIIDKTGSVINTPSNFLKYADDYFKNREFRSEIYARSFSEGMEMFEKGLLPREKIADYIASRVANPTKEILEAAAKQAEYVTYQTKLGQRGDIFDLAKAGQQIKNFSANRGPFSWLTNYYLPFIRTPTNIAGFVAERTPIAAQILTRYNKAIAAGGREAAEARAKLALGSSFYLATMPLGYYGMTTGSDLRGGKSRLTGEKFKLQRTLNKQPFELQFPIGDGKYQRISTRGFDPVAQMFANSANLGQYLALLQGSFENNIDGENTDYNQLVTDVTSMTFAYIYSIGENLANSTMLTGAGKFVDDTRKISTATWNSGLEGFKKSVTQVGGQMASSYVPAIFKEGAKLLNSEHSKIATEFQEYFQKTLNDGNLEYDYDHRGRRIPKFSYMSQFKRDAIDDELYRVMPNLSPIQNSIPYKYSSQLGLQVNVPLTSAEKRFVRKNAGIKFNDELGKLFNSQIYKDETRRIVREGMIRQTWNDSKNWAKQGLLTDQFYDEGDQKVNHFKNIAARAEELRDKQIKNSQGGFTVNDNLNNYN